MIEKMKELREFYSKERNLSEEGAISMLSNILEYCHIINLSVAETRMAIGLVTGVIPLPRDSFTNCREYNEHEKDFIKTFRNSYDDNECWISTEIK
jgi:hypothetical protein